MKTNRIIALLAAALFVLPFQSCLKDMDEVFDESASARLSAYNAEVAAILTEGKGEWIMHYYAGTNLKYGGYDYYLKFTDKQVTAAFEMDTTKTYTSLYKLTNDNGPVLSFDTYNKALHYFATPSSSAYQAMGGDFEFTIMSYEQDRIVLKGKRSSNLCTLVRADGTTSALDYVRGIVDITSTFRASSFEGNIGGSDVTGSVSLSSRTITFVYGPGEEDQVSASFSFTPDGLAFYNPVKVNGCTIDRLWYVSNNNLLTNGVFTLKGSLPQGWKSYDEFLGDFVLTYRDGTLDLHIKANDAQTGYILSGMDSHFEVRLGYDKSLGRMTWKNQIVGTNGSNNIILCIWDTKAGYLTWVEDYGFTIYWDDEAQVFKFEDDGTWETYVADSFILYERTSSGTSVGEYKDWDRSRWIQLESLKRK